MPWKQCEYVQYAAHRMIQQTHMQPVTEQQVVCMWVVWVLNIHPGWHPLQAKMDYRSRLPTSCGSGLLPRTGNNKCMRKVARSSHEFHTDLILQYSISILCRCCFTRAFFNDTLQHCSEMRLLNCRASFLCGVSKDKYRLIEHRQQKRKTNSSLLSHGQCSALTAAVLLFFCQVPEYLLRRTSVMCSFSVILLSVLHLKM